MLGALAAARIPTYVVKRGESIQRALAAPASVAGVLGDCGRMSQIPSFALPGHSPSPSRRSAPHVPPGVGDQCPPPDDTDHAKAGCRLLLLALVLWCVVHSVYEAEWADDLDLLVPLTWLLMGVGIVAAKSGLRRRAAHAWPSIIGVEAIVERFGNRMTAVKLGRQAQRAVLARRHLDRTRSHGGNSRDNVDVRDVHGGAARSALGYVTAWLVYKRGAAALAVVICARAAAAPPLVQLQHAELPLLPAARSSGCCCWCAWSFHGASTSGRAPGWRSRGRSSATSW